MGRLSVDSRVSHRKKSKLIEQCRSCRTNVPRQWLCCGTLARSKPELIVPPTLKITGKLLQYSVKATVMASRPMGVGGHPAGVAPPIIPGGGGMSSGQVGGPSPVITAGGAASTTSTGTGAKSTSLSALQEIEEAYNKRLDLDVAQLMESFSDIIKVASVRASGAPNGNRDLSPLSRGY